MVKQNCESSTMSNGVATSTVGWGIVFLSFVMILLFTIFKTEHIIDIPDLYIWIAVIMIIGGGIIAIIGSSITKSCAVRNFDFLLLRGVNEYLDTEKDDDLDIDLE